MQASEAPSLSLSFSSYSNSEISEIAARAVEEFDSEEFSGEIYLDDRENPAAQDDEFEFAVAARDFELLSQTSAGEIFQNGKIRPVYSVFDRDGDGRLKCEKENEKENKVRGSVSPTTRLPLRKLFLDERETTITRSSEREEVHSLSALNNFPNSAEEGWCKKSGRNSKRWKLRDFLHRSNSDGSEKNLVDSKRISETPADGGKIKPASPCILNGGDMQISYLRYGHDLAELFSDVNALRKKLESF